MPRSPFSSLATWSLILIIVLLTPLPTASAPPALPTTDAGATARPASVLFVENVGQFAEKARFQAWGGAGLLWLADDAMWIAVPGRGAVDVPGAEPSGLIDPHFLTPGVNLKLTFLGAAAHSEVVPFAPADVRISFFTGVPANWRSSVPVWAGVQYVELYPGINLAVGSAAGQWRFRLEAKPTASLDRVRLRVEGAGAVRWDGDFLRLSTTVGDVRLPFAKSTMDIVPGAVEETGAGTFDVTFGRQRPTMGKAALPLDNPSGLLYGTFLGGSNYDYGIGTAVDSAGAVYVTGGTLSSNFPSTPGVVDPGQNGSYDAFALKFDPAGELVYATFLGAADEEAGWDLAVDPSGAAYLVGFTDSSNFPTTTGSFDGSFNGAHDAFVAKLGPLGDELLYSTFLGGSGDDCFLGTAGLIFGLCSLALDSAGDVYVTGNTLSTNFPVTAQAWDTTYNGSTDAFVTRLDPAGAVLLYSTFLGGSGWDGGFGIALAGENSFIAGATSSADFPTTTLSWDATYNGGDGDAFVAQLNLSGTNLLGSTFLGGAGVDHGIAVAVGPDGAAYVTGGTASSDFPTTTTAFDPSFNGNRDGFLARVEPACSQLSYATFFGGQGVDRGTAILVDNQGQVAIAGPTSSSNFPTTPDAFDQSPNGYADAFLLVVNPANPGLVYSTFVGGNSDECWSYADGRALVNCDLARDPLGRYYLAGYTGSTDWPTTAGAFDTTFNGMIDAFLVKLNVTYYRILLPLVFKSGGR